MTRVRVILWAMGFNIFPEIEVKDSMAEQLGPLERKLSLTILKADYEPEINKRLRELGPKANIKGFRVGKVPFEVVKKHFGSEIQEKVLGELVQNRIKEAIQAESLSLATDPQVSFHDLMNWQQIMEKVAKGEQVDFSATFEVFPEIDMDLSKITLEKPMVEITEADLDKMVERIQQNFAVWSPVDRAVQTGDRVIVDFEVRQNGELLEGSEPAKDFPVDVGAKRMIPGFEEGLMEHVAGDQFVLNLTFPAEYPPRPALAGQAAEIDIQIKEVQGSQLPELTEEFLKEHHVDPPTLSQLRAQTREQMEKQIQERTQEVLTERLYESILKNFRFDLPKSWVDSEMSSLHQAENEHHHHEHGHEHGPNCDHDHDADGAAENVEKYREEAQKRVALTLFLRKYIEQEKLVVTQEMFDTFVKQMGLRFGVQENLFAKWVESCRQRGILQNWYEQLLRRVAADHLLERVAKVDEPAKPFFEAPLLMG